MLHGGDFNNMGTADLRIAAPATTTTSVICSCCGTPHMAKSTKPTRTGVLLTFTCQNPRCDHRWSAGITRGRC
ncbi:MULTISPECIES: hypothetical protein [unclassified Novosphingobium]|uniref:hypothetical protein n=1 Tax=unclassified Novosphingobium TaxID=2644732 RepID=UPI00105C8036|nr:MULTISPECIES: hypothetical protein [unclassified Novosphingobium]